MKKIILSLTAAGLLLAACHSNRSNSAQNTTAGTEAATVMAGENACGTLEVAGSCGMCKTNIEKAALGIKGVGGAEWSLETKSIHLCYDPSQTNLDAISKAIAKAGYDTEKDKAEQSAYDALPACCKYR